MIYSLDALLFLFRTSLLLHVFIIVIKNSKLTCKSIFVSLSLLRQCDILEGNCKRREKTWISVLVPPFTRFPGFLTYIKSFCI